MHDLGFDKSRDEEARDVLSNLLTTEKAELIQKVSDKIMGKEVIMFGAGPSLESDIKGLYEFVNQRHPTVVAADGAADALYVNSIIPSIVVSDLDSCTQNNLERCSHEGLVFVHAHGDNTQLVKRIVPSLGSNVIGTTQVSSVANVTNYGGLTDGDRACFVVCDFHPLALIVAGMDFGKIEGRYSVSKHNQIQNLNRPTKLTIGRESLEFLIKSRPEIRYQNVTKFGEEIKGARRVNYSQVT
ncbi:MAG: DUF115 domain-containing protein [Nitrososphaerota archaeon]|nr:DUF115 domain-containing protein [Nitrososphaerota archaeon]